MKLQEFGDLHELYVKWWKNENKYKIQKCDASKDKAEGLGLTFSKIGGIFLAVITSLCLALLIVIIEFFYKTKQSPE